MEQKAEFKLFVWPELYAAHVEKIFYTWQTDWQQQY